MFRSFGLVALGLISLSGAAFAQPDAAKATLAANQSAPRPVVQVNVIVPPEGAIALGVRLQGADVTEALTAIATRGNLQLVIKKGVSGTIAKLDMPDTSPEYALAQVCEKAHFSLETHGGVWVVSPLKAPPLTPRSNATPIIDSIEFRQTEVRDVLAIITREFNISIVVDKQVKGQIPLMHLNHLSPREAIETIALAVDATVSQDKDGTLHINAKPAT